MKKAVRILIYICAFLQIIGGLFTIYVLYKSTFNPNYQLFKSLLMVVPVILLNLFGGITLLLIKSPKGIILSVINYVTQIIQFQVFGLFYDNVTGPYVAWGFFKKGSQNIHFWWDKALFISNISIRTGPNMTNYFLTVNLIALFFLFIIILEYLSRKEGLKKLSYIKN